MIGSAIARITVVSVFFLMNGCMTLFTDKEIEVQIVTRPAGATVCVAGQSQTSPCAIRLGRGSDHLVTASLAGYRDATARIASKHSVARWTGSIILNSAAFGWYTLGIGTVLGTGADIATGSVKTLAPDVLEITLEREGADPRAVRAEARGAARPSGTP